MSPLNFFPERLWIFTSPRAVPQAQVSWSGDTASEVIRAPPLSPFVAPVSFPSTTSHVFTTPPRLATLSSVRSADINSKRLSGCQNVKLVIGARSEERRVGK